MLPSRMTPSKIGCTHFKLDSDRFEPLTNQHQVFQLRIHLKGYNTEPQDSQSDSKSKKAFKM